MDFYQQACPLEKKLSAKSPWKVIIADDEVEVHTITKLVLEGYEFDGRDLQLLSAYTAQETLELLRQHPDTALILLDVVMETGSAGLDTVKYIREKLNNDIIQIILRTGQPGYLVEQDIITRYEINDYKSKSELTAQKLLTSITSSLRAYKLSSSFYRLNKELKEELRERKKAQQALLNHAQLTHTGRLTALGEMASGMAHEINQPLTIIRLISDSLKTYFLQQSPGSGEAQAVDRVIEQVKRAAKIIKNMRTFARAGTSHVIPIDLRPPVQVALSFFREQFRISHIDFDVQLEERLPLVMIDPQKFEQIIVNLLSNARYAVEKKSGYQSGFQKRISIHLYAKMEAKQIILTVSDNGIGMSETTRERCMEPFFTTKDVGEGTGLGLSIVHGIINEFNMKLELETEEGEATSFRVLIPFKMEGDNAS